MTYQLKSIFTLCHSLTSIQVGIDGEVVGWALLTQSSVVTPAAHEFLTCLAVGIHTRDATGVIQHVRVQAAGAQT